MVDATGVEVFVYGTLRPHGVLFATIADGVINGWDDCTADGRLYFVHGFDGYPVADFDESGIIHGTVLVLTEHALATARMIEFGAGYDERTVTVDTPLGTRRCITFHWPYHWRGDPVPGGDWYVHLGLEEERAT